jgi:hypothetical protein
MLEKAIATTRRGEYTNVQYARFADDLVKQTGKPTAGNPHGGFDAAGIGNGLTVRLAHVCGFSSPRVRKYLKTQERVVIFGILW